MQYSWAWRRDGAGQVKHVIFKLDPRQLSEVDANGIRSVQPRSYKLPIGGSQSGDSRVSEPAQTIGFAIQGTQELPH